MEFLDEDERLLEEALETEELYSVPNVEQAISQYKSYANQDLRQYKLVLTGTAHVNQLTLAPHNFQLTTKLIDALSQVNVYYDHSFYKSFAPRDLLIYTQVIITLLGSILELPVYEDGHPEKYQ